MNKTLKVTFLISAAFMIIVLIQSCTKDINEGSNGSVITSSAGTSRSHNMGQNCMNCHKQGGSGDGWFIAAGTIYDNSANTAYPNATIKFYTGPNATGTLMVTISGDNLGNFYTSQAMNFTAGLYPAVQGKTTTRYMSTSISTGQCNSCHGVSTGRSWGL